MPARLEVICGPMFSGKTEELLRRIQRASWRGERVAVVKPHIDTRTEAFIAARAIIDGQSKIVGKHDATVISNQQELVDIIATKPDVLAINEGQFFEPWLVSVITDTLEQHKDTAMRIIIDGLDRDYRKQPFGCMPALILESDDTQKLKGVCMACGDDNGIFTQRLAHDNRQILVGDLGQYQVRCRKCHYIPS